MDQGQLDQIAAAADQVAAEHEQLTDAAQAEREQAAALLSAVVERVRPAIPALASSVCHSHRSFWVGQQVHHDDHNFPWRGLHVWGAREAEEDYQQGNDGSYEGTGLFLVPYGGNHLQVVPFRRLDYEGRWSRHQGASSSWEASDVGMDAVEVVRLVGVQGVEAIVRAIASALQSHVGKRDKATKRAKESAVKLAALRKLL